MRYFLIACTVLISGVGGCAALQPHHEQIEHVVIIWLKEPGSAQARQQLIDRSYEFTKIPGITNVVAGPMLPSDRKTVDSTYDVGVVMTFKDAKSLREYDKHPIHQQAVKEVLAPLASRYIAYDFIEEGKH